MTPLLKKLLPIRYRIPLDQVLELREIRREECAAADFTGHGSLLDPTKFEVKFKIALNHVSTRRFRDTTMSTIPSGAKARNLRACLLCSIIQTGQDFKKVGCPNCDEILQVSARSFFSIFPFL